jgi:hypothetical protein
VKKNSWLSLVLILGFLALAPHVRKVNADFVNTGAIASQLVELTNAERTKAGLQTLSLNPKLTQAAYAKANDMLSQGFFSHTGPSGRVFYSWVDSTGYEYTAVGENLAVNLDTISPEEMVASWLNSPLHRANLLSSTYTEMGMGVSYGVYQGRQALFAVHIFAHPKKSTLPQTHVVTPIATVQPSKPRAVPNKIIKNTGVLGESFSNQITSPELATNENVSETLADLPASTTKVELPKNTIPTSKNLWQKIVEFLLSLQ